MTLTQIRYFLELCKTMNFTKAAENLYVVQPTLSRQVQLLETELGVTLLKRSRREVILTQAGEMFRNEFSRIDDEIEFAIIRVKKAGEPCQEIRVGFSESVLPIYVLNLVEQLKSCFPEYSIQMSQGYYYEMMHQFERGKLNYTKQLVQWVYDLLDEFCHFPSPADRPQKYFSKWAIYRAGWPNRFALLAERERTTTIPRRKGVRRGE